MKTDAKTLNQTLDEAPVVLLKSWVRVERPEEDRDSTERPTESTNLDPWGFMDPGTEPPTKEQAWAGAKLPAHI